MTAGVVVRTILMFLTAGATRLARGDACILLNNEIALYNYGLLQYYSICVGKPYLFASAQYPEPEDPLHFRSS